MAIASPVSTIDPPRDLVTDDVKTELTVEEFHELIQQRNDILLLDVRNDKEYDAWRIESQHTPETLHSFYGVFVEDEEEVVRQIPRGRELVVICAKGGASDYVAEILRDNYGLPAANLIGGTIAWGNYYVSRPVVEKEAYQIYQIDRVARGCLSYVLISQGRAVIIDPARHIDEYQRILTDSDAELELLLDTHAHADHISGGPALAEISGAPYHMHPYDGIHPFDMLPATLDYEMLKDGQEFTVGDLNIRVIHVPGHTLGQVNFLVTASDGETFLFTGDNIFLQSFGRPDLGGQGESWAPLVFESIFGIIKKQVPSDALVLPGHYARHDEAAETGLFAKRLGDLWQENQDLQRTDQEEFIQFVLSHLPTMPSQYVQIKRVNAGLVTPDEHEASELELGKNICALSTAY
jgi:glyoxylase-like metal-dependent hydrolase (beta-lactamase superfamily II)/rhodanese-related sulfurtransferase